MTNYNDFYQQRDHRTISYLQNSLIEPKPLQVCWGEDAAHSPAGQMIILTLSNQLARFCRKAGFSGPDAPLLIPAPLGGASLHQAILTACKRIDPCGQWILQVLTEAVYRLGVGRQSSAANLYLGADGWIAYAALQAADLAAFSDEENLLGAGMAACIGAANAFKVSLRLSQQLITGTFSLWSFKRDDNEPGPTLVPTTLGNVLIVGAGAVASALVYWLCYFPITGQWDIVDHDDVQLDNTNRGLLFTSEDARWEDHIRQKKVNVLARYMHNAKAHAHWFDEFETHGKRWDLILPLANEHGVRGLLQASYPPLMIHTTTSANWQTQLHRHRPGRDRCINCRLPESHQPTPACAVGSIGITNPGDEHPPDAALPFLSAAAGLLIVADLLRLGLGEYEHLSGNWLTLDWFADLGRPTVRQEKCLENCQSWGHPHVRHILNHTTRWYTMDRDACTFVSSR